MIIFIGVFVESKDPILGNLNFLDVSKFQQIDYVQNLWYFDEISRFHDFVEFMLKIKFKTLVKRNTDCWEDYKNQVSFGNSSFVHLGRLHHPTIPFLLQSVLATLLFRMLSFVNGESLRAPFLMSGLKVWMLLIALKGRKASRQLLNTFYSHQLIHHARERAGLCNSKTAGLMFMYRAFKFRSVFWFTRKLVWLWNCL